MSSKRYLERARHSVFPNSLSSQWKWASITISERVKVFPRHEITSMATEDPETRLDDVEYEVNVSEHLEFIDLIEANPDEAMLSFRASGVAEDTCNRTTATISDWGLGGEDMNDREHTLKLGLPTGLEEPMGVHRSGGSIRGDRGCARGIDRLYQRHDPVQRDPGMHPG